MPSGTPNMGVNQVQGTTKSAASPAANRQSSVAAGGSAGTTSSANRQSSTAAGGSPSGAQNQGSANRQSSTAAGGSPAGAQNQGGQTASGHQGLGGLASSPGGMQNQGGLGQTAAGHQGLGGLVSSGGGRIGGLGAVGGFGSNFRGPAGPMGEMRTGLTPDTRNYQAAEIARSAYPGSNFAKASQAEVAAYMGALSAIAPSEGYTNKYGTSMLPDIQRVAINQVLAGRSLKASLAGLDSTKMRAGTKGLQIQGPAAPGTALHTTSQMALNDALMQAPGALKANTLNANNFVAGSRPYPGTTATGTYKGSTYSKDPAYTGKIAAANAKAAALIGGPAVSAPDVQVASASPSIGGLRVANFAAKGKPATGASLRVANFAAKGKPVTAGSLQVADFAARGKPTSFVTAAYPGRPGLPQTFNSQIASRPDPQQDFASMITGRPAPTPQFNSMVGARPEKTGFGFPAAFASNFPARPAPHAGFASQVAARPDPQQNFMSQMATRQEFPGTLPAAPVTGNFPGRPSPPRNFNSMVAGRPGAPQTFNSQIASRTSQPGAFPAAQPQQTAYADPAEFARSPLGRAFASIGNGIGSGFGAFNEGMQQFEDHKGLINLANAVGVNPIGKAVKTAASQGIRNLQGGLPTAVGALAGWAGGSPSPTQVAGNTPAAPSQPQVNPSAPQPEAPPEVVAVEQQRSNLSSILASIMGNGGPKTEREQKVIKEVKQALATLPTANDYSLTYSAA